MQLELLRTTGSWLLTGTRRTPIRHAASRLSVLVRCTAAVCRPKIAVYGWERCPAGHYPRGLVTSLTWTQRIWPSRQYLVVDGNKRPGT